MALKKNLALMGASTGFRVLAGLITFSVVARLLGPASFGVLMFWLSVSVLLGLITNYGLTPYVLREIGLNPAGAKQLIADGLTAKLLLTIAVIPLTFVGAFFFDAENSWVLGLLMVASLSDSFGEFLNAGLRASNRFDVETRIATVGSFLHASTVIGIVSLFPSIEAAAAAYALSRSIILALTVFGVWRYFSSLYFASIRAGQALIVKASSYAVDFGFQSLFGHVDSLVLNHFIGPVAVGLHQAGMRVFQGGMQAATVLSNVFLPRAAAATSAPSMMLAENNRVQIIFLATGFVFGGAIAVFSHPIVMTIFGHEYSELIELMPFFGLLFFLKFSAGAWGLVLTAAGKQKYRSGAGVLSWVLVAVFASVLVPDYGNKGWLASVIVATAFLAVTYGGKGFLYVSHPWVAMAISVSGVLVFLPLIYFVQ